jgi:hypothetical protein
MREYKCYYCKNLISKQELFRIEQKDKLGTLKVSKTGKQQYNNYHKKCYEFKEKENKQWCELFEYIRETYFNKILPDVLILKLKKLRESFNFEIMLLCLKDLEKRLLPKINSINFIHDGQKCLYLYKALQGSIDGFYGKYKNSQAEQIQINETYKQLNHIKINDSTHVDDNDYDFLD